MKKILIFLPLLLSYLYSFDRVSVGYGLTTYDTNTFNLAFQKELDWKIFDNTNLLFEVAIDSVEGRQNEDLIFISVQPILSYDFTKEVFGELGIGIAYFDEKSFKSRRFGKHFQFKESVGLGYRFNEKTSTTFKYVHYSNAYLHSDNSGFDVFMLSVNYKF